MSSATDLKHDNSEQRMPGAGPVQPVQSRKPWVTPIVSQSPINEVTLASAGIGADLGIYS